MGLVKESWGWKLTPDRALSGNSTVFGRGGLEFVLPSEA